MKENEKLGLDNPAVQDALMEAFGSAYAYLDNPESMGRLQDYPLDAKKLGWDPNPKNFEVESLYRQYTIAKQAWAKTKDPEVREQLCKIANDFLNQYLNARIKNSNTGITKFLNKLVKFLSKLVRLLSR